MIAGKTAVSWRRCFPLTPALDSIACPWLQGLLASSGFGGEESEELWACPWHGGSEAADVLCDANTSEKQEPEHCKCTTRTAIRMAHKLFMKPYRIQD